MDNSQSSDSANPEVSGLEVVDLGNEVPIETSPNDQPIEALVEFPVKETEAVLPPPHIQHLDETDELKQRRMFEACAQYGGFPLAVELGVTPNSFQNPLYRKVFRGVIESEKKDLETGLIAVLVRMRDCGELSKTEFNEARKIDDIPNAGGTDRYVRERIEIFIDAATKREVSNELHDISLQAKDGEFSGLSERLESASQKVKSRSSITGSGAFGKLQLRKFDPLNLTEPKPPILTLNEISIMSLGNLLALVAADKSGKSHVLAAIAKAITKGGRHLGIESPSRGRVAYLDFEQDREDFENLMIHQAGGDASKMSGYHLTGYTQKQALEAVLSIIHNETDIKAVLLDGFADLISDVNDPKEANEMVAKLMAIAEEKDVAIIGVLHLNPGSEDKSRGHLGSQLGRKAQTVLQIKVEGDTRILFTQRARKKPIPLSQGVRFEWSDKQRGFIEIHGTPAEIKQAAKVEEWTRTLYDIHASTGMLAWNHGDLKTAIMAATGLKDRTAATRIQDWLSAQLLKHDANKGIYTSTLPSANVSNELPA